HGDPGPVEYPQIPGQRHGQLDPHRIQRMVAEVVPQQLVRPDDRGVRHERATGRAVSVIHSLHEPTYSAGSGTPASVSARIVLAAVTPDPQYAATGRSGTRPAAANRSRSSGRGSRWPSGPISSAAGRLTAPGMCPATGSTGSSSPRYRVDTRTSNSTPVPATRAAPGASTT